MIQILWVLMLQSMGLQSWSWLSDWTETTKFTKLGELLSIQIYMYKITINVQYKSLQICIERMFILS